MPRLNRFECIGHLGQDPALSYTQSQKAVCNLSIAVNNGQKQPDGSWSDDTLWVRAAVWNEAGERAAEQLAKGDLVYAEGQLGVREYERKDGTAGFSVELKFARVMSLERHARDEDALPRTGPEQGRRSQAPVQAAQADLDIDAIPF